MSLKTTISGTVEGVGIALESIRANKVRAALTILGVAVGVFVVVAIGAMITGINNAVTKDLAAAGPTTFFVDALPDQLRGLRRDGGHVQVATESPAHRGRCGDVPGAAEACAPSSRGSTRGASARYRGEFLSNRSACEAFSADWLLVDGRRRSCRAQLHRRRRTRPAPRVAVLNEQDRRSSSSASSDPIGKQVIIGNVPFDGDRHRTRRAAQPARQRQRCRRLHADAGRHQRRY
ncbi:MAG: ABC transporter permease [Gemmatimonadaceae bacterium]|nr:ABC transporter permease [Gemmatimonadaceae bacterium]